MLIGTDIFLELMLDQKRADECEKFLNKLSRGEIEGIITWFTIHAVEEIANDSKIILTFLRNIENSVGLWIYETTSDDELAAAILMENNMLDFDDALQYYIAKKVGAKAIISFDKHFDSLDIPRREPGKYI